MNFWKLFLIPFGCLYGIVVRIRHFLFNIGLLKSVSYPLPVIGVGNLSLGGTGKTPFVEYLIDLLSSDNKVATLSRGYGRKTKGFLLADSECTFEDIGDEPMQYFQKYSNGIMVAVGENRRNGIGRLLETASPPDVILLDDSFQHRYVKPGLSILLTDKHKLYTDDYLLPAGTLRDTVTAAKRADIIVVTKTNKVLSPFIRKEIVEKINVRKHQELYFSYISYGRFIPFPGVEKYDEKQNFSQVILFSGIANAAPLIEYIRLMSRELIILDFPDHHVYKQKDLLKIKSKYDAAFIGKKLILTTEKDAMRLINSPYFSLLKGLPLYYIPIRLKLHAKDRLKFKNQILEYVKKDK